MALVVKSVGSAGGRDYSTWAAWAAGLSGFSGDDCVGEGYNDSAFTDSGLTVSASEPTSVVMTAASGEQNDGTAGSGVRITPSGAGGNFTALTLSREMELSWIEISNAGMTNATTIVLAGQGVGVLAHIHHCLLHHNTRNNISRAIHPGTAAGVLHIHNCVIYAILSTNTSTSSCAGINSAIAGSPVRLFYNNTIHDVVNNNGSGPATGLASEDNSNTNVRNNLVTSVSGSSSGTKACFGVSSPSSATMTHNASSDATASGTGSLTSLDPNDLYIDTTPGSEVLLLKAGADVIDAGTDLSSTGLDDIEVSITGVTRPQGSAWDIGADEFVSAAPPSANRRRRFIASCAS